MSLLVADDDKELARLNELERQLKLKKEKISKNATRQKILLGAFLLDLLENDKVAGLRNYAIENLEGFVTRDSEKNLVKPVITNVKKLINTKANNTKANNTKANNTNTVNDKSNNVSEILGNSQVEKYSSNDVVNMDVNVINSQS